MVAVAAIVRRCPYCGGGCVGQKMPANDSLAVQMVTPAICTTCVKRALHVMAVVKWRFYEPHQKIVRRAAAKQFGPWKKWNAATWRAVTRGPIVPDTEYVAGLVRGEGEP